MIDSHPINVPVAGQELSIVPLDNANVVAKPEGNLVDTDAVAGQEARKSVAHDVGRDPGHIYCGDVPLERSADIVSVEGKSFRGLVRGNQVLFARGGRFGHVFVSEETPIFETSPEGGVDGDTPFLSVLGAKCWRVSNGDHPGVEIDPIPASLDNLPAPKTAVEAEVKNELYLWAPGVGYQLVPFSRGAETQASLAGYATDGDAVTGIHGEELPLHAPAKEAPRSEEVGLGGGFTARGPLDIEPLLNVGSPDSADWKAADVTLEQAESYVRRAAGALGVPIVDFLTFMEGLFNGRNGVAVAVITDCAVFFGTDKSFGKTIRVEGNACADSVDHSAVPVDVAAQGQAGDGFHPGKCAK